MRILKLCLFNIFGLACLFTCALASQPEPPGQCKTPGAYFARLEEPWQFINGAQPDAENALNHQGYTFVWHGNPDTTFYPALPDPTLTEFVSDIGADAGAFFLSGDSDNQCTAVEVYPHTTRGRRLALAAGQNYANHGFSGEVYLYEDAWQSGWAVALSWSGVSSRCNFNDAIVDIETCISTASGTWTGARVEFVNDDYLSDSESFTNTDAIWGGLDGQDGWKRRTASWGFAHASSKCHMREPQTDGGKTTLAPCVKWFNFDHGDQIPDQGLDLQVLFDTEITTVGGALSAFEVTRPGGDPVTFTVTNAQLANDTTLTVHVAPVTGSFGASYLSALSNNIVSKCNSNAHLDGSQEGGPDDMTWRLKHGQDPAAEICTFAVDENGLARWEVSSEYRTEKYLVQGLSGADWVTLATIPAGQSHYEQSVGAGYPAYRLIEVETGGHEIMQETAVAHPIPTAAPDTLLTDDQLRALLDEKEHNRGGGTPSCGRGGDT